MKLVDSLIASLFELQINLLHARLRLEANTDDEALHIGFVVHSAVMDVDADGFEAAAATAAGMEAGSAPMEVHELDLDRPFGFALVHVPTRTVLFAGHVGDPTA